MSEETAMETVLNLRRKILARPLAVAWPSSEPLISGSQRRSRRKGVGQKILGQKVYDPADGDDPRRIDYNATAAEPEDESGDHDLIVQTFRSPRIVRTHVLLDVNKSMNLGTGGTFKSLLGALLSGCCIASARKSGDLASFISYSYCPVTILKPRGAAGLLTPALLHAVKDRGADDRPSGSETSAGGGLALALRAVSAKNSNVVVVISGFADMEEDDWEALRIAGLRHDTIAVFVQDKRERELPAAPWPGMQYRLEDFRGHQVNLWVAPDNAPGWYLKQLRRLFGTVTTRKEYAENFARHEAHILKRLTECNVTALVVSTEAEDEAVQKLLASLASKRAQA